MKAHPPSRTRRILIGLGIVALIGLTTLGVYAYRLCAHNDRHRAAWDRWTAHLSGPPPWTEPEPASLVRFRSTDQAVMMPYGGTAHLYGYMDESGKVVIEPAFTSCAETFHEGLAAVSFESAVGYIAPTGRWVVAIDDAIGVDDFQDGMGRFRAIGPDGSPVHGFVNRTGEVVIAPKYYGVRGVNGFVDGYAMVLESTVFGRVGRRVAKALYVNIDSCLAHRFVLLDKQGREVPLDRIERAR